MDNKKAIYKADIVTCHSVGVVRLLAALGLKTEDHIERIVIDLSCDDVMKMTVTRHVDEDQLKALTEELEQHQPENRQLLGVSHDLTPEWNPK